MPIKRKNKFYVIFLFVSAVMVLVLNYVNSEHIRQLLRVNLLETINQHEGGTAPEIDFSNITPFSWDRLYIFGPYSDCKAVSKDLGTILFWFDCKLSEIESSEYKSLFVFMDNGRVVQYLVYETVLSNSTYVVKEEGYALQESRFILDEYGELIWVSDK